MRIRPYSAAAAIVATASLGGATLLRIAVGWLGVSAPFSTFFPAVLVTALLAGVPAAVGVIAVSVLIAWWTFLPPTRTFNALSATDLANISIFVVSSALIVVVAHLYRGSLRQLRDRNNERELLMHELEHRGRNTYAIVETIVRNMLGAEREKADIIAARVRMTMEGARVLGDGVPKIGAHGKPVLFFHPKDFSGALVEIEQA